MLTIGHRGAPSKAHENTIESFKIAFDCNVDGIEFDIQFTKDNKLVVYHDFSININNKIFQISNMTLSDIQNLNLEFNIPTFEDVLKICSKNKIINVEIKSTNICHTKMVNQTISVLKKYNFLDNVIISSFNPFVLLAINKHKENIKIGLLWSQNVAEKWYVNRYSNKILKPYSFHADINYIDTTISNWANDEGMKLFLYTVNTEKQVILAKSVEAHGIFSDYPNILD